MTKGKKKLLSLFLAAAMIVSSICVPGGTANAADTHVAQGKTVTVSSVEAAVAGNTGDQTVDGSTSTRWSSELMKNSGATDASTQTPQWLVIDLSAEKTNVN